MTKRERSRPPTARPRHGRGALLPRRRASSRRRPDRRRVGRREDDALLPLPLEGRARRRVASSPRRGVDELARGRSRAAGAEIASSRCSTALREWFETPTFRGCAFINAYGELGWSNPAAAEIVASHKRTLTEYLAVPRPAGGRRRARRRHPRAGARPPRRRSDRHRVDPGRRAGRGRRSRGGGEGDRRLGLAPETSATR